jgi:hypothetical protein
VAGPFDLGNLVIRAAADVDPTTAQVSVSTDPLPRILNGIPLRLRSIALGLDRSGFIRNPTSCEPMSVTGTATAGRGPSVPLSEFFQVGGCAGLPFEPGLSIDLLGGLGRSDHPAVRAVLRGRADEAAIAAMTMTLPAGELLDLRNVRSLCAVRLSPERCPRASRLGRASVLSPLLDEPVQGPIHLRAPSDRLPDLVADLRGDGLHFVLHGQTVTSGGHLRIRFPDLPDIPLSKAVLTLSGGRHGILVNSEGLCGRSRHISVSLGAHDGDRKQLTPHVRLRGRC